MLVDPEQIRARALAIVRTEKIAMLATLDGLQPRVRPVAPVGTAGLRVYVASLRRSGKTGQIAGDPNVELCYRTAAGERLRLAGTAGRVRGARRLQRLFDGSGPLQRYAGTVANPELIVYEVIPRRLAFAGAAGPETVIDL